MESTELISNLSSWQVTGLLTAYFLTGVLVYRWTRLGDAAAMIAYNYPILGVVMMGSALLFWPIGSTVITVLGYIASGRTSELERFTGLRYRYNKRGRPEDSGFNTDFQNTPYPNELSAQSAAEKEMDRKYSESLRASKFID